MADERFPPVELLGCQFDRDEWRWCGTNERYLRPELLLLYFGRR